MTYEQCRDLSSYLLYKPFSVQKTGAGYDEIGIADPAHDVLQPLIDTLPQDITNPYGNFLAILKISEWCRERNDYVSVYTRQVNLS